MSVPIIKNEALETMYRIAGRLVYLGFEAEFGFEPEMENRSKYSFYVLYSKSPETLIDRITVESDIYDEENMDYELEIKLPEKVFLDSIYTKIEDRMIRLCVSFNFTDFVNANLVNKGA